MYATTVRLEDIDDCEAFVAAALLRAVPLLKSHEREDLIAEGMLIVCALHANYKRSYDDFDRPVAVRSTAAKAQGSFAGYVARFLPGKLRDAWHRSHPEHLGHVNPDGSRGYTFLPAPTGLDDLLSTHEPSREDTTLMELASVLPQAGGSYTAQINRMLDSALRGQLAQEHEFTLRVGVMRGMGMKRADISTMLGVDQLEVRMAEVRLRRVAPELD